MHELGIVYHIIDTLEQVAKENELTHIDSVTMEVGEVSAVIPDYLTDCWAWASGKNELMRGCRMVVEPRQKQRQILHPEPASARVSGSDEMKS